MTDFQRLHWGQLGASLVHLAQAGYAWTLTNTEFKDKGWFPLKNGDTELAQYRIGNLIGAVPFLSAVHHGWAFLDRPSYESWIKQGYNPARWLEYSVSAGLMLVIIAQLSEINDIKWLLTLFLGNMVLQSFGLEGEQQSQTAASLPTAHRQNYYAFILLVALWIPIFIGFGTAVDQAEEDVPLTVYFIVIVLFCLFLSFGLVHTAYLRGRQKGAPGCHWYLLQENRFARIEWGYLGLSFVAKTLLTNLTLFGALRE